MKKTIAIVLLICMLLGALPVSAAREGEIPFSVLAHAASFTYGDIEFTEKPAKRAPNCYAVPSPLMEGQEAVQGKQVPLRYILACDGERNVFLNIYVFKCSMKALEDPNFNQEPVGRDVVQFAWEDDIKEYSCWWTPTSTGTYSVLSFTTYNGNEILTDSALAFEIKVGSAEKPMTGLTITDEDAGKQVDAFYMKPFEARTFVIGRTPNPTTDARNIELNVKSDVRMDEYHGIILAETRGLGFGTATLKMGKEEFIFETHTCSDENGHSFESTQIRTSAWETHGIKVHACGKCGYSYVERQPKLVELFRNFVDVPENAWFRSEVADAVARGLFNGMDEQHFGPNVTMSRAMLVTALWRYAGKPTAEKSVTFSDVKSGQWYADAVAWASGTGVVNGVGDGRFAPDATVTREQLATILFRYAQMVGADTTARQPVDDFSDGKKVSHYATDAIEWTVAEGIIGGSQEGDALLIMPQGEATRAQVSAIMVRTIRNVLETDFYEPERPEAEVTAEGKWYDVLWTIYDDGTLTLKPTESEGTCDSMDAYINSVKCIKFMHGMESTSRLSGGFPNLERVEMADSMTSVGKEAFFNCPKLKQIRFSPNLILIDVKAFSGCSALETLELPKSLQYLYASAFSDCTGLKEVHLPDGLTDVNNNYVMLIGGIFSGCTSLETVYLGAGRSKIPSSMFRDCKSLRNVVFAAGINEIGDDVFEGCDALTEITLPKEICYFSDMSFSKCNNLQKITILNPYIELTTIYDDNKAQPPFPEGCLIRGFKGSTAHEIALQFGYAFEEIAP